MDHLAAAALVEREAAALVRLLEPSALSARVPHCPGWTLADLARHTSGVHRWAAAALVTPPGGDPGGGPAGPTSDDAVPEWCARGAAELVAALRSSAPDAPCWTFAAAEGALTAAFWSRRMVHETSVHRWDAQVAVGGRWGAPDPTAWVDADVAADGVAEVADVVLPRQVRLGRLAPLTAGVALVDAHGRTTLLGPTGAGGPAAVVTGPAPVLLLLLWRRVQLGPAVRLGLVAVDGDQAAAHWTLGSALAP